MFTILVVVGTMTFANYDNPATGCGDSSLKPPRHPHGGARGKVGGSHY